MIWGMIARLLALVIIATITVPIYARDLGKRGNSFEIVEQAFLEMIAEKGEQLERSGLLAQEQQKMQKTVEDRINNPSAVSDIVKATKNRKYYHEPLYRLEEDAILPCGKVLYRAGTTVNPLEHMNLERRIFFIDGRDDGQVKWLQGILKDKRDVDADILEEKIILIGGSPLDLAQKIDREVYFDQHGGEITSKWGIKAVPAVVEQEGKRLRIEEVKITN